jgi:hypothetical protein
VQAEQRPAVLDVAREDEVAPRKRERSPQRRTALWPGARMSRRPR